MNDRPTLAHLRGRVFKHSADPASLEIGNWLARRVGRPSAVYGTWLAVRCGLSAHQVTLMALVVSLASAVAIGTGSRTGFVLGVFLSMLAYWLDHVDGQVARWRGTAGLNGVFFDYLLHHAGTMSLGFALGYGLVTRSGDPRWAIVGFAMAFGWTLLSLFNDCRYKAFFQRLKRETSSYRVSGGSGGSPKPPLPWPRQGRGALTWPMFKICEPHVVLVGLVALGFVAVIAPRTWLLLWQAGALAMAILAPILAIGRITRAITQGSIDEEFHRWFQPADETTSRSESTRFILSTREVAENRVPTH
jgi:hypothetical protein